MSSIIPKLPKLPEIKSIVPQGPRQSAEVTGLWAIGIMTIIQNQNLTWQQTVAIVALCVLGHSAATKRNR